MVIALGVGSVLFWYLRLILPAKEMHAGSGDLYTQIYPMALRAADWMRKGHIPLWNPLQLCGQPFLGSVLYGIFYPLNFPFLLFSTAVAIEVVAVLHLFATGVLTYVYARYIRISRAGAALAGIVFMLGGFVASQALWFTPSINAITWLPLGFLAVEMIFAAPRFSAAVLLAVAVAMPVLAGWLQTWTYSMHATAAYAGFRFVIVLLQRKRRQQAPLIAAMLAAGFLLGAALAAIQLLPSLELQSLGPRRPGGLSLLQTLSMGPIAPNKLLADAFNSSPGFPRQMYIGILPLVLLTGSAFVSAGRLRVAFLWALSLWSIAVALTVYSPLFTVFRALPGGSWFRVPWRIVFLYGFAAALLSGIGLDIITGSGSGRAARTPLLAAGLMSIVALGYLLAVSMSMLSRAYMIVGLGLVWALVLFPRPAVRNGILLMLIALVTLDLFIATKSPAVHPYHDLSVYDGEARALDFVKEHQGLDRTYIHWSWPGNPALMPKQGTLRGIFSITDYEPLSLDRYDRFFRLLDGRRATEAESDPNRTPFIGFLDFEPSPERLRLLSLMSVRFIVTHPFAVPFIKALQNEGPPWVVALPPKDGHYMVYENPTVLPRAYVAHNWEVARDRDDALRAVSAATFDARRTVVLEPEAGETVPPSGANTQPISAAEITGYQPSHVEIDVNDPTGGFLVLTDAFYPGWKASIDDRPAVVQRANYLFRTIAVPPGHHRVAFVYDPRSFKLGAALTLGALSCIVGWAGTVGYRRWRMRLAA